MAVFFQTRRPLVAYMTSVDVCSIIARGVSCADVLQMADGRWQMADGQLSGGPVPISQMFVILELILVLETLSVKWLYFK